MPGRMTAGEYSSRDDSLHHAGGRGRADDPRPRPPRCRPVSAKEQSREGDAARRPRRRRRRARVADPGRHVRARGLLGAELSRSSRPSGAERRSRPSCAGTRRRRSTAATRCGTATCSSSSLRRLRRRRSCARVRPGGLVVLNRETRFPHTGPFEIARVPASRIARENGILSSEGRPMGNVAVLGACVRLLVPGRARVPGAGRRVAHGRAWPRRTSPPPERATRAARDSTRSPATRRSSRTPDPAGSTRRARPSSR